MSERKGRNREDATRGRCLSIALHPLVTDDSGQALDLPPNPCGSNYRGDFGGKKFAFGLTELAESRAPFARASEVDRNSAPGYSWLPHLYQERLSVRETAAKREQIFKSSACKKLLQLQRLERNMLRGNQQFSTECGFGGPPLQRFFGGQAHKIRIIVLLRNVREHHVARNGVKRAGSERYSLTA